MKPYSKIILLVSLSGLLIAGCKKNYTSGENQAILFQYEYINYAWGYQHSGFIIDGEGNILKYSNPEEWNFAGSDSSLTESQVSDNLSKCTSTGRKVQPEELIKFSKHIRYLASSKVSALKNISADAGSIDYLCYHFSENTGKYKRVIIKKEGDFTCENLNFYSKRIAMWMREINDTIAHR